MLIKKETIEAEGGLLAFRVSLLTDWAGGIESSVPRYQPPVQEPKNPSHSVEAVVYQYDKPFGYGCWMTSITTMNHIFIFLGYSEFPRWLPWQPIQILQYPKIIQQSIPI